MIIQKEKKKEQLCEWVAHMPVDSSEAACYLTVCLTKLLRLGVPFAGL